MKHRSNGREAAAKAGLEQAFAMERLGRWREAALAYRDVVRSDPCNAGLLHRLALVLDRAGETAEARTALRKANRLAPRDPSILTNLGNLERHAGNSVAATDCYRRALRIAPAHLNARVNLATLLAAVGRHDEACGEFEAALRMAPADRELVDALCRSLLAVGRVDEAAARLEALLAADPEFAPGHVTLGDIRRKAGRAADAEASYRKALALDRGHVEGWNNLAALLLQENQRAEAVACAHEAIRLAPGYVKAQVNLAAALVSLGRHAEALRIAETAIALDRDSYAAHLLAAQCHEALDSPERALEALRRCREISPDNPDARIRFAAVLMVTHRHDECMQLLDELLADQPGHPGVWHYKGLASIQMGQVEEGERCLRKAAELDPELPDPWVELPTLPGFDPEGDGLAQVRERLGALGASTATGIEVRAKALFALGRIDEARAEHVVAFEHYKRANDMMAAQRPFDAADHVACIDAVIEVFDAEFFAERAGWGASSDLPVFVVGMARSGTTLTEQILASHSAVHGAGELMAVSDMALDIAQRIGPRERYPVGVKNLSRDDAGRLARRHLEHLADLGGGAARVIDKLPANYLYLGLVALLFPRARVICMHRDPMDVCVSNYLQWFSTGHRHTLDLGSLALVYRQHERLMSHWRAVLPLEMFDNSYEDLVASQEARSRDLVDFLGLPWEEQCLHFYETRRTVRTASRLQVRKPIYASSVERWRKYGPGLEPLREALSAAMPAKAPTA